jgi:hemoglobin-like flavoprotein
MLVQRAGAEALRSAVLSLRHGVDLETPAMRRERTVLSEREIDLLRMTWARAAVDPDTVAALFYGRLFEAAPEVKPLFTSDMRQQGRKLMQMLGIAVHNAHRLQSTVPALRELGERHETYGAQAAHYPVVGEVLLGTLATALGSDFTAEARAAWTKTYGILASVMTS